MSAAAVTEACGKSVTKAAQSTLDPERCLTPFPQVDPQSSLDSRGFAAGEQRLGLR